MSQVNSTALSSFNQNHILYDQVRPTFPDSAVDDLMFNMMSLVPGKAKVLEVACGTGKFTRKLVERGFSKRQVNEEEGQEGEAMLVASDPSEGMIKSFELNFPTTGANSSTDNPPVFQASVYDLTTTPQATARAPFDAVIAAQAFHWFGTRSALRQLAAVLKPEGKLGLVWNYEDLEGLPATNWQVRVTLLVWGYDIHVPQYRRMTWLKAFTDTMSEDDNGDEEGKQYFEMPYKEAHHRFTLNMPRDTVWPYWASRSYITALPQEKQDEIRNQVEEIVYAKDIPAEDLGGENGDELVVRRATHIVCATKSK